MTNIAIEHGPVEIVGIYPLVIFHSYVKLPEGIWWVVSTCFNCPFFVFKPWAYDPDLRRFA